MSWTKTKRDEDKESEQKDRKTTQSRDGWDLVHIGGASGPGEGIPGAAKAK